MLKVYAVRDVKAESYGNLITLPAVGLALRTFEDAVNSPGSVLGQNPDDFSLYEIGTYDPIAGIISGYDVPKYITSAISHIKSKETN